MKKGHFALFFLLITGICFLNIYIEQQIYLRTREEKERMEESLLYATQAAAYDLMGVMEEEDDVKLTIFQESFFRAWFVKLGIAGIKEEQDKMKMHLPLMAYLTEDGGYFFYTEKKVQDGYMVLNSKWSEKVSYTLIGSEEKKREILMVYLKKHVSRIISDHNYIAEQFGIQYEFSAPYFLIEEEKKLNFPMIFVVFQGWPLLAGSSYYYENCIDAGAYIKKLD